MSGSKLMDTSNFITDAVWVYHEQVRTGIKPPGPMCLTQMIIMDIKKVEEGWKFRLKSRSHDRDGAWDSNGDKLFCTMKRLEDIC